MTKSEYSAKLRAIAEDLVTRNTPFALAVATVHKDISERVFIQGKNSSGSEIGKYNSTNPIYINPASAPRAVNHTGKRGKKIKSGFYESYKDFRKAMGREDSFVNWNLTGQLASDYRNGLTQQSVSRWVVELKNQHNAEKAEGLQKKYSPAFRLSPQEKNRLKEVAELELARLFV